MLVIIGLIIGGILVGQDLIKSAEIRAGISEIESFNAAANTFRSRFRGLPGDIRNGSAFFDSSRFVYLQDGNGNGRIEACRDVGMFPGDDNDMICTNVISTPLGHTGERLSFLGHLSAAELIPGYYVGRGSTAAYESVCGVGWTLAGVTNYEDCFKNIFPSSRAGWGGISVFSAGNKNYYVTGSLVPAFTVVGGSMTPDAAQNVDQKMDDGKPRTGAVQMHTIHNNDDGAGTSLTEDLALGNLLPIATDGDYPTNPFACLNEAAAGATFTQPELNDTTYATLNPNKACSLRFRMN